MGTKQVSFHEVMRWTDGECRDFLETMRWPDGPVCPKCGAKEPYTITRKTESKNKQTSLYRCRECKKQYTATVGTIFEDSKIPLSKWFAAIYLMCASKKGMSAHQIHRELNITYKSAWFLCHRVREAMRDKTFPKLVGTVEADETYIGPKTRRGHRVWHERVRDEIQMGLRPTPNKKPPYQDRPTVFGIIERGGLVRTMVVPVASKRHLRPIMREHIDQARAKLVTDGHPAYRLMKREMPHQVINHEETYVVGDVHTQNIENYWSLLKRGLVGTFHHVNAAYLPSYLQEFEYRFNRRKGADEERFAALVAQTSGRLIWFCGTPQPENPFA